MIDDAIERPSKPSLIRAKRVRRYAFDGVMRNSKGVVLTIYPGSTIGVRQLRSRKEYMLSIARVFQWAVEADLEARAAERRKARGGKFMARRGKL